MQVCLPEKLPAVGVSLRLVVQEAESRIDEEISWWCMLKCSYSDRQNIRSINHNSVKKEEKGQMYVPLRVGTSEVR
jgi:hypothetical protein